jgi:hypothetical protein
VTKSPDTKSTEAKSTGAKPIENPEAEVLFREVDEELRHDQFLDLWRKYGNLAVTAGVAVVLGVAGWQIWQSQQTKSRLASSDRFSSAVALIDQGKRDDGIRELDDLAKNGTAGYRLLSRFEQAEVLVANNDPAGAAAKYDSIAADKSADRLYRDMATVKSAYLTLDAKDPEQTIKQVADLTADASPWRHSAREITALAEIRRGDMAKARDLLKSISDDQSAPQGMRARASEVLKTLPQQNG